MYSQEIACFGVPSIFSFKSTVCQSCDNFQGCQKKAHCALMAIADNPVATGLIEQHNAYARIEGIEEARPIELHFTREAPQQRSGKAVRYALTLEQETALADKPKKVAAFVRSYWTKGKDREMKARLRRGDNPFDRDKARPYHVAYECVHQSQAHRSKMCHYLMTQLGWSYEAAYSQVSMIWHIFPLLGLAEVDGAFLKGLDANVHPVLERHNISLETLIHA